MHLLYFMSAGNTLRKCKSSPYFERCISFYSLISHFLPHPSPPPPPKKNRGGDFTSRSRLIPKCLCRKYFLQIFLMEISNLHTLDASVNVCFLKSYDIWDGMSRRCNILSPSLGHLCIKKDFVLLLEETIIRN